MTKSTVYRHWKHYPAKEWRWPNFTPEEMACHGDNSLMIDTEAMDKLQALRSAMGVPFVIHSAYRAPAHNAAVGGAPRSRHMMAEAFDIRMSGHDPHEFETMARAFGFGGIGRYAKSAEPFLHIDTRQDPATWGDAFPYGEDDPKPQPHPSLPAPALPAPPEAPPARRREGGLTRLMRFGARLF